MKQMIFRGQRVLLFRPNSGSPAPAGHADTWVKYIGDTEWTPVSIKGTIAFINSDLSLTGQIENPFDIVSLEIGTDVTSIGDSAFAYCSAITGVTIPDSVMSIGNQAFYSCYSLRSVTFLGKTLAQVQNIEDEGGDK